MSDVYKRLGSLGSTLGDELEHVLYASGSVNSAIVNNITVTNTSSSEKTFSINFYDSSVSESTVSGVTASAGYVFAVQSGNSSLVGYSTNGIVWSQGTLPTFGQWRAAGYGNGISVALSNGSDAAWSTNGISWTLTTMPLGANWTAVAYGSGKFVAVGGSSGVATSTNGKTWTQSLGGLGTQGSNPVMAYGNGVFVVPVQYSTSVYVSTNGLTWTARTTGASGYFAGVAYGNGLFVLLRRDSLETNVVYTSTDAITWTNRTIPSAANWERIKFANGRFVSTPQESNKSLASTDGLTWSIGTLPQSGQWYGLGYSSRSGLWTALNEYNPNGAYSTDGITWTSTSTVGQESWYDASIGAEAYTYYSTDNGFSLYKNAKIAPETTEILEPGIVLNNNNTIVVKSSDNVSISAYGVELDDINKYKQLGKANTAGTTNVINAYTVPSGKQAIVKSINITNPTTGIITLEYVAITNSSSDTPESKDYVAYKEEVNSGETITIKSGYTMASGNTIKVLGNADGAVVSIFGAEIG